MIDRVVRGVRHRVRPPRLAPDDRVARIRASAAHALAELSAAGLLPAPAAPRGAVRSTATDVGTMAVHADDRVITPVLEAEGTWEAAEAAFLRARIRPGDVVVDVGANIGYFTLLAARAVGPQGLVLAVEPEPGNLALLRANVWRHGLDQVVVLPVAAGTERGLVGLHMAEEGNTGSFETGAGGVTVPVLALDEVLGGARVDVVKVDVQGGDHEAIGGMRHALGASPRCVVLTEFWLDGMATRGVQPSAVLASYRASSRPVLLLGEDGTAAAADDAAVLAVTEASPGRWVNLVLDALPGHS